MFSKSHCKLLVCSYFLSISESTNHLATDLLNNKETNNFLPGMGAAIAILERINRLPVLQLHLTGVSTVQPASGLDSVLLWLIRTSQQV